MTSFNLSESLLKSALVTRNTTITDIEYETGVMTGKGPSSTPRRKKSFFKKYQRSPNKKNSWTRRRRLGSKSIAIPQDLCDLFTEGERASLNIIANVIKENDDCRWPIDKIAAIAGVCRRTVQNAIAKAKEFGLLHVELRPVRGRKNLPNIVKIINVKWLLWLKNVRSTFHLAIGCNFLHPTGEKIQNSSKSQAQICGVSDGQSTFFEHGKQKKPDY